MIRLPFLGFHSLLCISAMWWPNKLESQRNMLQKDRHQDQGSEFLGGWVCTILAGRQYFSGRSLHTLGVRMVLEASMYLFTHPCQSIQRICSCWGEPLLAHSIHFSKDRSGSRHYLNTVSPQFKNTNTFNAKKILIETNWKCMYMTSLFYTTGTVPGKG